MKIHNRLLLVAALGAALAFTGGCSKKSVNYVDETGNKPESRSMEEIRTGTITEEMGPSETTLDADGTQGEALGSLAMNADQNSDEYKKMYGRSSSQLKPVYFDFDQAIIRGDQVSRIEHNADYLKTNPNAQVIIEGNSDERGTNEYNLALGERRALNAKNYLIDLGVEEFRIRTVSYGEERPLFPESDEWSWSQNRRDDFVLE